ncbi:CBS domain-containing protein [Kribbella sp. DT2]|uniref:CBS domain-containing protein n=1 Tax=Kribbella sp. DT2 TaxID=3393427 RepID=UPI003CF8679A
MHGEQMAEDFPVVSVDSGALEAVQLLAGRRLPGLIVVCEDGTPYSVLPASQVVRFLVPSYVQDDPSLARVIGEPIADQVADKLSGVSVRQLLPKEPAELPVVKHDDTVLEVAALMARLRSPLVAVVKDGRIIGAITASRLLELVAPPG